MLSKEGERKERERGENSNVRVKDKVKTKQVDFLLIKTGKNSALLYGNFSTGKWDLWDFGIMGFGNYGICDLWDFGIMGEGGEEGRNRERKVGQEPWSIMSDVPAVQCGPEGVPCHAVKRSGVSDANLSHRSPDGFGKSGSCTRVSRRVGGIGLSDEASLVESGEDDHDRRDYTKDGKDILLSGLARDVGV